VRQVARPRPIHRDMGQRRRPRRQARQIPRTPPPRTTAGPAGNADVPQSSAAAASRRPKSRSTANTTRLSEGRSARGHVSRTRRPRAETRYLHSGNGPDVEWAMHDRAVGCMVRGKKRSWRAAPCT
jgi:hypothetical protein